MAVRDVVTLDGSAVHVDAPADISGRWSSVGVVDNAREFTANHTGFAGELIVAAEKSDSWEILDLQQFQKSGGSLTVALARQLAVRDGREDWVTGSYAIWEGLAFSLYWHDQDHASTDATIAVLDRVQPQEAENGLIVTGVGTPLTWTRHPDILGAFEGLSLLEISPLTPENQRRVPPHTGTPSRGGQLYVNEHETQDGTRYSFILIGDNFLLAAIPFSKETEQATADALAETIVVFAATGTAA
jgi:hypothetical protein